MKKRLTALKIILMYLVLGLLWVVLSNKALPNLSNNMDTLIRLEAYKGILYILISSALLYMALSNYEVRISNHIYRLKMKNTALKQEIEGLSLQMNFNEFKASKLEEYANLDELTGLYNRRKGMELIEEELLMASGTNTTMLLAFVDVDCLKWINDKYGHIEGDILLTTVSGILRSSVRENDIICRFGGDEFLIAFPGVGEKDVAKIKNRIQSALSNYNIHSHKTYSINCSIGFTEYCCDRNISMDELIEVADKRMYEDKKLHKLPLAGNFK